MMVDNQDESDLTFTQKRAIIDSLGWEPFQEWFYDNEFRYGIEKYTK